MAGSVKHCHPEDPPTGDAEYCDDISQALSRSELGIFGFAARLEYLVKEFDLPAHGISIELFNRLLACTHGQIRDELPFKLLAVRGRIDFSGI